MLVILGEADWSKRRPADLERDNANLIGGDSLVGAIISTKTFFPSGVRLVTLPHAGQPPVHGRCLDLAGGRDQSRFRLHAGQGPRRWLTHPCAYREPDPV